jgi:hypothetical protein
MTAKYRSGGVESVAALRADVERGLQRRFALIAP